MKPVAAAVSALVLCLALTGCELHLDDHDDVVSQNIGSDYFAAGGQLNVTEPVAGDAMLAAGDVTVASEVKGDLVAAGGEVSIGGNVGDDLYAAGGNVKLDAIVAGNARIAGGDIAVGPATVVSGALSLTGGNIAFDGDAKDYLQATGAKVRINGNVQGDVTVRAEDIEIGPQTRIDGKLEVHSASRPVIPEGAVVGGGMEYEAIEPDHAFDRETETVTEAASWVGSVMWFIGVFLAGALFLFAFPRFASRAAATIGAEPLKAIGVGFAVLVCAPILGVMLLITVIGIPIALLLVPVYLLLLFLGWVTCALFLGEKALAALHRPQPYGMGSRLFALAAAILGLWALGHIPLLGGWIKFVALIAGIGALAWQAWARREPTMQAVI